MITKSYRGAWCSQNKWPKETYWNEDHKSPTISDQDFDQIEKKIITKDYGGGSSNDYMITHQGIVADHST